jgi:hypothetical protein
VIKPAWDVYKQFGDEPVICGEAKVRHLSNGLAKGLAISVREAAGASLSTLPSLAPQQSTPVTNSPPYDTSQKSTQQTSMIYTTQPVASRSTSQPSTTISAFQASVHHSADMDSFCYRQPQHSLLDDEIPIVDFTDPVIQPLVLGGNIPKLQNDHRPRLESLQSLSEVDTRTFYSTMNKRAPNSKSNPYSGRLLGPDPIRRAPAIKANVSLIDPLLEFVQELEESFQYILKPVQGFRGQVQIQADFGRVLFHSIHTKHVTSKDSTDNLKSPDSLQKLLGSADFTSFTKVLTTSSGEMPFLLNLSGSNGEKLWDKRSKDWTVEYEFSFIDNLTDTHQNSPFKVVINAETFIKQVKKYRPLGSIYVHGINRHWDFQLTATGVESDRDLREKYGELAASVESSLHVP